MAAIGLHRSRPVDEALPARPGPVAINSRNVPAKGSDTGRSGSAMALRRARRVPRGAMAPARTARAPAPVARVPASLDRGSAIRARTDPARMVPGQVGTTLPATRAARTVAARTVAARTGDRARCPASVSLVAVTATDA